uniref:Microfibril associated protein 5 n=1 Tax=Ursus americanus TaxID=9643 RepID=A0A452Q8Z9_URSAM
EKMRGPETVLFLNYLWTFCGGYRRQTPNRCATQAPLPSSSLESFVYPCFLCWTSSDCRDEKFACTRLYSVHRPVKQCIHQLCFTSLRRMYIINNEICSRLVCKEHEKHRPNGSRIWLLRRALGHLLNPINPCSTKLR